MLTRIALFAAITLSTFSAAAKPAEYFFCVQSESFPTFKAHVVFRSVDFGETAARQMVFNDVRMHLGDDVTIKPYSDNLCQCDGTCPILEVTSKDWDGNLSGNDNSSIVGSAAEVLDKLVYETKELFTDPGSFLKRKLFGENQP